VIDTSPQTGYLTAIPEMFGLSPIRLTSRPHKERQRLARTHGRGRERQANWTAHLETGTIGTEGSNSSRSTIQSTVFYFSKNRSQSARMRADCDCA
jgi:hypothetical protein